MIFNVVNRDSGKIICEEIHIILGICLFIDLLLQILIFAHPRKKPYNVGCFYSALYVVDLVKFRETAAGDQLRVFYETLSKDPNSLSNLDQVSEEFLLHFTFILLQKSELHDCLHAFSLF